MLIHAIKTYRFHSLFAVALALLVASCSDGGQRWEMNSLSSIGGHPVKVFGDPEVIEAEGGEAAIQFDGTDDGLLIAANPISGAEAFSIQMVIKPNGAYPENVEQRFLHIQDPQDENRRILMELRLNNRNEWYPDFFIKADTASLALIDSTLTYPVNEWATMKLVYQSGQMKGYINGQEVLGGDIQYLPIGTSGRTSIGTRMDKRSWFYGAIKLVEFNNIVED